MAVAPGAGSSPSRRRRWPVVALVGVALVVAAGIGAAVAALVDDDSHSSATRAACPVVTVARDTLPSVVTIQVGSAGSGGSGSGEVIRGDGEILTNDHVVSSAASGGAVTVVFNDGETEPATIVGRDPATDLAVLKVRTARALRVIPFGASSKLHIGEPVVALGAPLGLSSSVTAGIVSALERSMQLPSASSPPPLLVGAVQTDAAINPGNSGGALVDCAGKLIGVPTAGAVVPSPGGASGGSIGIGFAIPSEFAKTISDELIANGSVTHSTFGVQVSQLAPSTARDSGGLFVTAVTPAGPADSAGLRPGDIITEIDGTTVSNAEQLQAVTLSRRPGEAVKVVYERDGTTDSTTVTLGSVAS